MHFGENQLSPSSLGISPLPTAPPTALQRGTVRASSGLSPRLTLAMGSSPGFGPTWCDTFALLRLACAPAPGSIPLSPPPHLGNSPVHSSIGTPSGTRSPLRPTVCFRFQALFHSPRRGPFHRSLTVLLRYRSPEVLAPWGAVPPASHPVPRAGRYSRLTPSRPSPVPCTGLSPSTVGFPTPFHYQSRLNEMPHASPCQRTTPIHHRPCDH
jgi:hypothetical protein